MKTLFAAVLAFSATLTLAQDKPMSGAYKIDAEKTKIEWLGKKVGGQHSGTVKAKEGSFTVQGDLITSGTVVMDMQSITVTDIGVDDGKLKLEGHLKNADFFDVDNHKTATITLKKSEKTKDGLKVMADATIRGVTKPVKSFQVTSIKKDGNSFTAKATIIIDRTVHGVEYNMKSWADAGKLAMDKVIDNDFTITVDLTATK